MTAVDREISGDATSLSGNVALVSGGAIGIGEGIAVALADAGADVAVTCHQHSAERVEIAPGLILGTPFHEQFTPPADQENAISRIPLGRAGRPADVASLVTYLASESSSFLTGEVINLSGGQQLT